MNYPRNSSSKTNKQNRSQGSHEVAYGRRREIASLELEAQVLGALLVNNNLWREVSNLEEEHFTDPAHVLIWNVASGALRQGRSATPALIAGLLGERLDEAGGRGFLSGLAAIGADAAPAIQDSAERLRDLAQWRRLYGIKEELEDLLKRQEMGAGNAMSRLSRLLHQAIETGPDSARSKHEVLQGVINDARNPSPPTPTGIDTLDFMMQGGLVERRTYGIGALYGRGKTILMGSISDNLNRCNVPHLIISLETPPEEIEIRDWARHLKLNASQISDPDDPMREKFLKNAERYMVRIPNKTFYEYLPGASIDKILRLILRAVHRHGIKGVFIDYWQLITGQQRGQSEDAHFASAINRIAALCRQERIWSVVIAQTDEHGRPLRSTSILQAANLFFHMKRDPNDQAVSFMTEKNNHGRYADAGGDEMPGAIFDPIGPHLRSTEPQDANFFGQTPD